MNVHHAERDDYTELFVFVWMRALPCHASVACYSCWSFLCRASLAVGQAPRLRVPEGFEVTEWADNNLAPDCYCLTVGPAGQVIVSGRGYIRQLAGDKGTNSATQALEFAQAPRDGAMGLCWDQEDLYCMGDGGLRRYRNAAGEGRNRPPELLYPFKTGGEHAAHAIRRGPDGWLYVLVRQQHRH